MSVPNIESLQPDPIVAVDGVADELAKSLPWSENLAEEWAGSKRKRSASVPRQRRSRGSETLIFPGAQCEQRGPDKIAMYTTFTDLGWTTLGLWTSGRLSTLEGLPSQTP